MLLRYLPREASYVQAVAGPAARWGDTEHLLAGVIDVVNVGNYYTEIMASNRRLTGTPKPPKPIRRPDDAASVEATRSKKRAYTQEQMREVLDNWNEKPEEVNDGS